MSYQAILLEKKAGVAIVTMNLPKSMNALEQTMIDDLGQATKEISDDESIKAAILTGVGRAFCAGGDVKRFTKGFNLTSGVDYFQAIQVFTKNWTNLKIPTIAAVNGMAVGAGLTLSVLCDIVIAGESAKFGAAFISMGLVPDLGLAYFLPRVIGLIRAKEMLYTGRLVDSHEAQAMGLAVRVTPDDKLAEEAFALAAKFAQGPTFGLRATKKLVQAGLELGISTHLDVEAYLQAMCLTTEDSEEALKAFLEKRKPVFKGQ